MMLLEPETVIPRNAFITPMTVPRSPSRGDTVPMTASMPIPCASASRSSDSSFSRIMRSASSSVSERPGVGGAFRMGTMHGVFCLGCCWFLMALLFYGGVMNLIWIIGLASFVLAEKMIPAGVALGRVTGLLLIAWGVWLGFTAI